MTCLEYRRLLLAGASESAPMSAHRMQCGSCAELLREQLSFERELKQGLEVPLSPGLEASLASAFVLGRRRFLAAAAVAAMAIGAGAYAWLRREDPLAMACIDFVMKEEAKSIMMGAMPRAKAEAALAGTLPLARLDRIGQIRHVGPCPFNGATAYHVVLAVPQGKVTLLIMPASTLSASQKAVDHGMYARVIPLASGSVGIVGSDDAVVASVAGALRAG